MGNEIVTSAAGTATCDVCGAKVSLFVVAGKATVCHPCALARLTATLPAEVAALVDRIMDDCGADLTDTSGQRRIVEMDEARLRAALSAQAEEVERLRAERDALASELQAARNNQRFFAEERDRAKGRLAEMERERDEARRDALDMAREMAQPHGPLAVMHLQAELSRTETILSRERDTATARAEKAEAVLSDVLSYLTGESGPIFALWEQGEIGFEEDVTWEDTLDAIMKGAEPWDFAEPPACVVQARALAALAVSRG